MLTTALSHEYSRGIFARHKLQHYKGHLQIFAMNIQRKCSGEKFMANIRYINFRMKYYMKCS